MIKRLKIPIILLMAFIILTVKINAATYDEILDNALDGKIVAQYNVDLNAPFSKEKDGIYEDINPENGEMTLSFKFFELNSRSTLKTNFALSYNQNSAKYLEEAADKTISKNIYYNYNRSLSKQEKAVMRFGIGWKIDLPYVEIPIYEYNTRNYLHLSDGRTYKIDLNEKNGLSKYQNKDISFSAAYFGEKISEYILKYIDGTTYYFSADGLPKKITDRYGNSIQYSWLEENGEIYLKSISDNAGNVIKFEYNKLSTNIICNDKYYTLIKEKAGDNDEIGLLKKIIDPQKGEISLEYEKIDLHYILVPNSAKIKNSYFPLKKITYAQGFSVNYKYLVNQKKSGYGYSEYLKLEKRFDLDKSGNMFNSQEYIYTNDPNGYPTYVNTALPKDYEYSTRVLNQDSRETIYKYSSTHELYSINNTISNKPTSEMTRYYDDVTHMPVQMVEKIYNQYGEYEIVSTDCVYDKIGNILSNTTYGENEDKEKYKTTYRYSSGLNFPIYQSKEIDENRKLELIRTLDRKGTSIAKEEIRENGISIKITKYKHDVFGNVISISEEKEKGIFAQTEYIYSNKYGFSYPTKEIKRKVENADGNACDITKEFEYDKFGNVTKQIDGNGNTQEFKYDLLGRVVKEILPDKSERTFVYNDKENSIITTDASGTSLQYKYDCFGKLLIVTDLKTGAELTKKEYDKRGNIKNEYDAMGSRVEYVYNIFNKLSEQNLYDSNNNLQSSQSLSYNEAFKENGKSLILLSSEIKGENISKKSDFLFDIRENLIKSIEYGETEQKTTFYNYDYVGNNKEIIAPNGVKTSFTYDVFGNTTQVSKGGICEKYVYDLKGNNVQIQNSEGEIVWFEYDNAGRLIKTETMFDSYETKTETKLYYDNVGNNIKKTDAEGNETLYMYNARNLLTTAILNDNSKSSYTYDKEGRMLSQSIGNEFKEKNWFYEYDYKG